MKIPLAYPKISDGSNCPLNRCFAFEKCDGTNLHFNWSLSDHWHKFGTRRTEFFFNRDGVKEFNKEHPGLENAIDYFNYNVRDSLTAYFSKHTLSEHHTVFCEFFGPNSFAGQHSKEDAEMGNQKLVIIDVSVNNKLLSPQQLIEDFNQFGGIDIAKVIYKGKYSGQFANDVRNGKYPVNEGVVCKGIVDGEVYMCKIKTNAYMERLKMEIKDNWKNYWE